MKCTQPAAFREFRVDERTLRVQGSGVESLRSTAIGEPGWQVSGVAIHLSTRARHGCHHNPVGQINGAKANRFQKSRHPLNLGAPAPTTVSPAHQFATPTQETSCPSPP